MTRRPSAALAALALGALAACSEPIGTETLVQDGPGVLLAKNASGDELPVLENVHSNRVEPVLVDAGRFQITLRFLTSATPSQRAAFETAAARWEALITKDKPSITGTLPLRLCVGGLPDFVGTVDDIMIDVILQPIDGPGRILGSAGPCFTRNSDNLPVYGIMFFDTADLAFLESPGIELLDEVVVHEMGHVLGIGTLWNFRRALRSPTLDYLGEHGNDQYAEIGGVGPVPIENTGGPGTLGGHWRESVFNNELMTGFLNLGENPLSRISSGTLRDLGYRVNMAAEAYALPVPQPATASVPIAGSAALVDGLNIEEGELLFAPVAVIAPEQ